MKPEEQIKVRLIDSRMQMAELIQRHEKAYQKYLEERKILGYDADRGEMEHVSDLMTALDNEIKAIEWVLDIEKHGAFYQY